MTYQQDAHFMAHAIKLAKRGLYTTDPNPRVGCVLVKDDLIIAEGWHAKAGKDHAEIDALKKTDHPAGATAYVSLEPCSHYGKTGPCCDALIEAGVKRVVCAMQDPNPLVSGKGIQKMQSAGIVVEHGVLQQDAESINRGFINRMKLGRPFVTSKMAMSLDGRTAMASGESQWITSPQARQNVQLLRAKHHAILTGVETVIADNPSLNVRLDVEVEQPVRIILDSRLRTPVNSKMVNLPGQSWILTCSTDQEKKQALISAGFDVFNIGKGCGRLDLNAVLDFLGHQQINSVLIEAGATLNGSFLAQNLVDEWIIYMAPCVLGDQGRGLFHLPDMQMMADKKMLQMHAVSKVGSDLKIQFSKGVK